LVLSQDYRGQHENGCKGPTRPFPEDSREQEGPTAVWHNYLASSKGSIEEHNSTPESNAKDLRVIWAAIVIRAQCKHVVTFRVTDHIGYLHIVVIVALGHFRELRWRQSRTEGSNERRVLCVVQVALPAERSR
jgi:hypothetical protein